MASRNAANAADDAELPDADEVADGGRKDGVGATPRWGVNTSGDRARLREVVDAAPLAKCESCSDCLLDGIVKFAAAGVAVVAGVTGAGAGKPFRLGCAPNETCHSPLNSSLQDPFVHRVLRLSI